jgi:kynurenine formamidase
VVSVADRRVEVAGDRGDDMIAVHRWGSGLSSPVPDTGSGVGRPEACSVGERRRDLPALRWIDLSLPLEPTPYEAGPLRVSYTAHRAGGDQLGLLSRVSDYGSFGRLAWAWVKQAFGWRALRARDFPGGLGLAWEHFRSLSSHHGTHLDAPWHYGPRCAGRPSRTVDEVPLDWCFAPGLRVDLRRRRDPAWIRFADVRDALRRDGLSVRPGRIVLLQTGLDRLWGTSRYLAEAPGVEAAVVAWLVDRGARIVGIDAFGFDRPFAEMYRDFLRTRDPRVLWPTHLAGREREYCQIEKLARLDRLPGPDGFWVSCLPVRIARGSAAWTRVAAAVPRDADAEEADHGS